MPIEAVALPPRSRRWTDQDVTDALEVLNAGQAAKFGEFPAPTDKDGKPKKARNGKDELTGAGTARSAGHSLNDMIEARTGKRYRVTVRELSPGVFLGALEPTEAKQKKESKPGGRSGK